MARAQTDQDDVIVHSTEYYVPPKGIWQKYLGKYLGASKKNLGT